VDPLSDVLSLLKPKSYITAGFDAGGRWCLQFTNQAGMIKCYAVTNGSCWLAVDGVERSVRLVAGDCFVLPTGRNFRLGSDLDAPRMDASEVFAAARKGGIVTHNGGGDLFLAGSRFAVIGRMADILLKALPPIIHLDEQEDQATLRWSIERMMEELRQNRPGSSLAAQHLAHMMLLQALRLHLSRSANGQANWFFALSDPQVSAAIKAMHADPAHRWTLEELAATAGLSRSLFAQRFREKVGETPIAYLTRWRMLLASDRLTSVRESLAQTASAIGYQSENSFNTAFKRIMGCSPRRFAVQQV
jgi:AraC-like DNA-binding protein